MSLLAGTLAFIFLGRFLGKISLYKNFKFAFWVFVVLCFLIGTLIINTIIISKKNPHCLHITVQLVDVALKNGNWKQF